jgi:hypothetical protein
MPKYSVKYAFNGNGNIFIEAKNEEEAREKFFEGDYPEGEEWGEEYEIVDIAKLSQKFYFTFGQSHSHLIKGFTYDKDLVVEIEAESKSEARNIMFRFFRDKWAFLYDELPDMSLFPRGIKKLN